MVECTMVECTMVEVGAAVAGITGAGVTGTKCVSVTVWVAGTVVVNVRLVVEMYVNCTVVLLTVDGCHDVQVMDVVVLVGLTEVV